MSVLKHGSTRGVAAVTALVVVGVLVGGCQGSRQTFGLNKAPPDEFVVVARAPLSLPPDYRLRPPNPGAERGQEQVVVDEARQAVFGIEPAAGANAAGGPGIAADAQLGPGQSPGEFSILARAGTEDADPDIRTIVDRESAVIAAADETFLDRLLNWRDAPAPGAVVDANAEAQRLRENQALGVPATTGDTPTIEHVRRAPLEGIF